MMPALLAMFIIFTMPQQKAEQAAEAGARLMESGKFCDALRAYRGGLDSEPKHPDLLYNGALAALRCKDFAAAADLLERFKTLDPDDWQVRAKLVQAYQALGKTAERDQERAALFEMRRRGTNKELAEQVQYCRERFEAGGEQVMVFEHFELKGDRALKYVFLVLNEKGDGEKYHISLGSYETTNAVWRERTKPTPPKDTRLYHLDFYSNNMHATHGMFAGEPSYDSIRAIVVKILNKEHPPASSSVVSPKQP